MNYIDQSVDLIRRLLFVITMYFLGFLQLLYVMSGR